MLQVILQPQQEQLLLKIPLDQQLLLLVIILLVLSNTKHIPIAGAIADGGETVVVTGTVDTSTPGTYTITYTATDAT